MLLLPSRRAGEEEEVVGDELSKDSTGGLPGAGQSPDLLDALMVQPA